ncbi:hypothetical protein SDC9_171927 [bioreactor metagenome]|uniref:Uncharacterized protein n=1 Tax=bioreactor metagenome TaxID=1076179 RepID=A0A645GC87_9ZZZZ
MRNVRPDDCDFCMQVIFLQNLLYDIQCPLDMNLCSRSARGTDQHRDMPFQSVFHHNGNIHLGRHTADDADAGAQFMGSRVG